MESKWVCKGQGRGLSSRGRPLGTKVPAAATTGQKPTDLPEAALRTPGGLELQGNQDLLSANR